MIPHTFCRKEQREFSATLRKRVNAYFRDNEVRTNANPPMIRKSVVMLALYLVPYTVMMLGGFTNLALLFALWMIMGFGKAFVGMTVMHDALHGSYSKKKTVNGLMGATTLMIGIDANIWKIQHNVLHHTYTNIEHADEDIESRYMMRLTPHQPRKWFHRYQHLYASFLYSLTTLWWVTGKDFFKLANYQKMEMANAGKSYIPSALMLFLRKVPYFFLFLVLPILVLDIPAWITVLLFVSMHLVSGLFLTLIFQLAHVMPTSDFVMQEEEKVVRNWFVHQLSTTSNFAMSNNLLSWLIGGLNFQIEHHLFPNICHIHYPKIAQIVQRTAAEFNVPYNAHRSFRGAIRTHFKLLRQLGRYDTLQPA